MSYHPQNDSKDITPHEREEGEIFLAKLENELRAKHSVTKKAKKALFCHRLLTSGKCDREVCSYAHSADELKLEICHFQSLCTRRPNCKFYHYDETRAEYAQRILNKSYELLPRCHSSPSPSPRRWRRHSPKRRRSPSKRRSPSRRSRSRHSRSRHSPSRHSRSRHSPSRHSPSRHSRSRHSPSRRSRSPRRRSPSRTRSRRRSRSREPRSEGILEISASNPEHAKLAMKVAIEAGIKKVRLS